MGRLGEKSFRFVVCAGKIHRAEVLFVFSWTKVLFVTGRKNTRNQHFSWLKKRGVVVFHFAWSGSVIKDSLIKPNLWYYSTNTGKYEHIISSF